jgi:hypothetical protein
MVLQDWPVALVAAEEMVALAECLVQPAQQAQLVRQEQLVLPQAQVSCWVQLEQVQRVDLAVPVVPAVSAVTAVTVVTAQQVYLALTV